LLLATKEADHALWLVSPAACEGVWSGVYGVAGN